MDLGVERWGDVVREFAEKFYKSRRWRECREAYSGHAGHLCELCLKKGLIVPGAIVHHKIPLTPENINDPTITLSFDNLLLVCRDCHAQLHDGAERRYKVDELGRVITK